MWNWFYCLLLLHEYHILLFLSSMAKRRHEFNEVAYVGWNVEYHIFAGTIKLTSNNSRGTNSILNENRNSHEHMLLKCALFVTPEPFLWCAISKIFIQAFILRKLVMPQASSIHNKSTHKKMWKKKSLACLEGTLPTNLTQAKTSFFLENM